MSSNPGPHPSQKAFVVGLGWRQGGAWLGGRRKGRGSLSPVQQTPPQTVGTSEGRTERLTKAPPPQKAGGRTQALPGL